MMWAKRGDCVALATSNRLFIVDHVYVSSADCKRCGEVHPDYRVRRLHTHQATRVDGCLIVPGAGAAAPQRPPVPAAIWALAS